MSGQNTTYINSAGYAPNGGLLSYFTNNNLLTLNQLYNMHQQVSYLAVARGNNYQGQNYFAQTMDWGTSNNNGVRLNGKNEFISNNAALPSTPTFSQTFSYDGVNRLLSASDTGGWSQTYSYDQYGNMWMPPTSNPLPSLSGAAPTTNIYNANNQNPNVSYDGAGNQTSLGSLTLSYDAENRQSQIANLGGGTGTFQYDGLGHRVVKSLPSQTTTYVYDAFGQLAAEYYSGTKPTPPCTTCFLTYDYLGNVRMVTDAQANIVARHDFAPFGQEIPSGTGGRGSIWGATSDVDMKFTGQIRDQEASEDFFNARYFAFALGRFSSPDPGNAGAMLGSSQSWNGYAYGLNNPLIFVDPTGRDCVTFDDGSKGLDPDRPEGGCGSIDENGSDSDPESVSTSADVSQVTIADNALFLFYWLNGQLPQAINYGPNDGMTRQLAGSATFDALRQRYVKNSCPVVPSDQPYASGHYAPFFEAYGLALAPEPAPDYLYGSGVSSPQSPNFALMQVGGFILTASTSGSVTTFTITNPVTMASFKGGTTFGYPVNNNPNGPTGGQHTVVQTFTFSEANLCKH